MMTSLCIMQVS